ncbi:MAG: CHASE2 domain-containing protein [Cyanobacteria bacterium SBLK]|nr:CHASE2 domain-containing protein [Cyanobacteria bacterium SBLK]
MSKLVVLELDGNFQDGFRIILEIYREENILTSSFVLPTRLKSKLPANPELPRILHQHWQEKYRSLGAPYRRKQHDGRAFRIKPQRIVHRPSREVQVEECRTSARELSTSFNQWLDSDDFRPIEKQLRSHLQPEEEIRFLIRTKNRQLQKLPWEEWEFFQHYPRAETALSPPELKTREFFPPPRRGAKVRILAILGHSEGIDIKRDRRLLKALPNAEVVFLVSPERSAVTDKIWENAWDIIFFAGHSETEGETGRIYLNERESLSVDELWFGLKKAVDRGLQLAIFNSCDGLGLSDRLDDLQIPQMIVMRELVPDLVAQKFLTHFLDNFAAGRSFYRAVREAKQRLHDELETDFPCASWLPVICQTPNAVPPNWDDLREQQILGVGETRKNEGIPSPKLAGDRRLPIMVSLAIAGLVMGVRSLGWLQGWELKHFDFMLRLRPRELSDNRFLLVTIGDSDRDYQDNLGMNRRDSLSPEALSLFWQKVKPHQPRVIALNINDFAYDPDINRDFVEHPVFLAACQSFNASSGLEAIEPPLNLPQSRLGFSRFNRDPDGIIRRQTLARQPSPACYTSHSLSLKIAQKYLQIKAKPISSHRGRLGKIEFEKLTHTTGSYQLPQTIFDSFQILINYRAVNPYQVSLTDIISSKWDEQLADLVEDKIILIGRDTTGRDAQYTPYSQGFWNDGVPSIAIHAQMASQLISAVLDDRPLLRGIPQWLENLSIVMGSLLGFILLKWRLKFLQKIYVLAFVSGLAFLLCYQGLTFGIWIPILPFAISFTSLIFVAIFDGIQ